jgi:hypothetical protein
MDVIDVRQAFYNVNNEPLTSNHIRKKLSSYTDGNPGPAMGHVQNSGGFKMVNGIEP